ncbi:hypothetical protein AVEN_174400-1 [Araneus ventricosus]|uniref:Uncharacterized protein n=1 Tax=Araneus ventricosus TaxID=182803 RepID=A0A4Y2H2U2_ARAVE|nr:hypothetical protein AVEN_174400-1 [Araneus ventricosus]
MDLELSTYFYWFHELSRDYVTSYIMKSLPVERQALKPRRVGWILIGQQAAVCHDGRDEGWIGRENGSWTGRDEVAQAGLEQKIEAGQEEMRSGQERMEKGQEEMKGLIDEVKGEVQRKIDEVQL